MLVSAELAKHAYKVNGYLQLFVFGEQGVGKTTYACLTAFQVYRDWDKVLKHLFFHPQPALAKLKETFKGGRRIPLIIFDDAGIYLSKYTHLAVKGGYTVTLNINRVFNFMRTLCSTVILTSPTPDILKDLREKSWFNAIVRPHPERSEPWRQAVILKRFPSLKGETWLENVGEDSFPLKLPNDVYREYERKRNEAAEKILKDLDKVLPENEAKTFEDEKLQVVKTLIECNFNLSEAAKKLDQLQPRFEGRWYPEQVKRIWKTFTEEAFKNLTSNV